MPANALQPWVAPYGRRYASAATVDAGYIKVFGGWENTTGLMYPDGFRSADGITVERALGTNLPARCYHDVEPYDGGLLLGPGYDNNQLGFVTGAIMRSVDGGHQWLPAPSQPPAREWGVFRRHGGHLYCGLGLRYRYPNENWPYPYVYLKDMWRLPNGGAAWELCTGNTGIEMTGMGQESWGGGLVLIGGGQYNAQLQFADIRRSVDGGGTFPVISQLPGGPLQAMGTAIFKGRLVVACGTRVYPAPQVFRNEVRSSADPDLSEASWVTHHPFPIYCSHFKLLPHIVNGVETLFAIVGYGPADGGATDAPTSLAKIYKTTDLDQEWEPLPTSGFWAGP